MPQYQVVSATAALEFRTRIKGLKMKKADLIQYALHSNIFKRWHYFKFHFNFYTLGSEHPLAKSIIDACVSGESKIPGFATGIIDRIAAISGRENFTPHYEQLIQQLAELHMINQVIKFSWNGLLQWEPTTNLSPKNPELLVPLSGGTTIGLEVKSASFLQHQEIRSSNPIQLPSRSNIKDRLGTLNITLPRDNPIKDFLISAESKFISFKTENPLFLGILVIVTDDFVQEIVSSLLSPISGLLTPNSFAKTSNGTALAFNSIDAIILIRHQHQFIAATRDEPFIDTCTHLLDYGSPASFPPKVLVANPTGRPIPQAMLDCLQTVDISELKHYAEYKPTDLIFWINT